jgi:hypothetical protein
VPSTAGSTTNTTQSDLQTKAANAAATVLRAPLEDPIDVEDYISEPPADTGIGEDQ